MGRQCLASHWPAASTDMTEGFNMRVNSYRVSLTEQAPTFNLVFLNRGSDRRGSWGRDLKHLQKEMSYHPTGTTAGTSISISSLALIKAALGRTYLRLQDESMKGELGDTSTFMVAVSHISGVVAVLMGWLVFSCLFLSQIQSTFPITALKWKPKHCDNNHMLTSLISFHNLII